MALVELITLIAVGSISGIGALAARADKRRADARVSAGVAAIERMIDKAGLPTRGRSPASGAPIIEVRRGRRVAFVVLERPEIAYATERWWAWTLDVPFARRMQFRIRRAIYSSSLQVQEADLPDFYPEDPTLQAWGTNPDLLRTLIYQPAARELFDRVFTRVPGVAVTLRLDGTGRLGLSASVVGDFAPTQGIALVEQLLDVAELLDKYMDMPALRPQAPVAAKVTVGERDAEAEQPDLPDFESGGIGGSSGAPVSIPLFRPSKD